MVLRTRAIRSCGLDGHTVRRPRVESVQPLLQPAVDGADRADGAERVVGHIRAYALQALAQRRLQETRILAACRPRANPGGARSQHSPRHRDVGQPVLDHVDELASAPASGGALLFKGQPLAFSVRGGQRRRLLPQRKRVLAQGDHVGLTRDADGNAGRPLRVRRQAEQGKPIRHDQQKVRRGQRRRVGEEAEAKAAQTTRQRQDLRARLRAGAPVSAEYAPDIRRPSRAASRAPDWRATDQ